MQIKPLTFEKFVFLAPPLEENSDSAFRTICHRHGADMTFSEMTRLQGLAKHNASTWSRLEQADDTPTTIQLLVNKESDLVEFLKEFKPKPGFAGFNMNMGCPAPEVVNIGLGAAAMKRIAKAQRLVKIFHDFGYPVSIKLRLGMNQYEKEKKAYLNIIQNVDADYFILHSRHGKQTYNDPADIHAFKHAVKTGKIIVANGDIFSREQIEYLKSIGVKGVMIGRAAVYNPAIFDDLKGNPTPTINELREEYLELTKQFGTKEKYSRNILHRLGRPVSSIKEKSSYQG